MKNSPKVIDLFSGVGGISLGAARAGFNLCTAVEHDVIPMNSHRFNFPNTIHLQQDISKLSGEMLLENSKLKKGELAGLIGGPPCQGFSIMGRQDKDDNRNTLFRDFFRLVKEIKPAFFLAENVPGILNEKYSHILADAFDQIRKDYVLLDPFQVRANDYGAPTTRRRIFFIGYRKNLVKDLTIEDFRPSNITKTFVKDALEGLPIEISYEWKDEVDTWKSLNKFTKSNYFTKRIHNSIPKGVGDPLSIERYQNDNVVSGCIGTKHLEKTIQRFALLEQGQMDPVSRGSKLKEDGFCPTILAGTGKDKGSRQSVRHIHFSMPRVITPREAARLQGFPDWFVFHPTKWHSFRQIGNSVSPIVAEYLLKIIFDRLQ
jgi:DNA (cytosine-5)-methyltransferase 1